MHKKYKDSKVEEIQGVKCYIPPVGYVIDWHTGNLKYVGILSRSNQKKHQ